MKTSFFLYLSALCICLMSCTSSRVSDKSNTDCVEVMCTQEYRTITVSIKDQNQNPVALDAFKVRNTENKVLVSLDLSSAQFEIAKQAGEYPITSDGNMNKNQELNLEFIGYINDIEVINSKYTVKSDCCHVNLISGELALILK